MSTGSSWEYDDFWMLSNSSTIICSSGSGIRSQQFAEVSQDKAIVWVLNYWVYSGSASAVQILDALGIPEKPGESEH